MKFATSLIILLAACLLAAGSHVPLMNVCDRNEIMAECVHPCPRICMNNLIKRRCPITKCRKGCNCIAGFIRKDSNTGKCMERSACRRWVL